MFNGELLFDNAKGYYSVSQTAKILGIPAQKSIMQHEWDCLKPLEKGQHGSFT